MARRSLALISGTAFLVASLLVALTAGVAAGGMGCHSGLERDGEATTVRLISSCMDPLVARVPTGGVVTFVNEDTVLHAVTGASNRWGTYEDLRKGDSASYRFTQDGVYPYFCYIHPGMIGAIVVGDGGPGGTGDSVQAVSNAAAPAVAATAQATAEPTPAPTAEPTAEATASAAAAAAPISTTPTSGSSPTGANSILILGLLAVLLGAGAAYGFGLVPGLPRPRTRAR
jgi:plastocyanin